MPKRNLHWYQKLMLFYLIPIKEQLMIILLHLQDIHLRIKVKETILKDIHGKIQNSALTIIIFQTLQINLPRTPNHFNHCLNHLTLSSPSQIFHFNLEHLLFRWQTEFLNQCSIKMINSNNYSKIVLEANIRCNWRIVKVIHFQ